MQIEIPNPVALNATINYPDGFDYYDYAEGGSDALGRVHVVLRFGTAEVARWDITDRAQELWWERDGGTDEEREWVSVFVAAKLAPLFAGIK